MAVQNSTTLPGIPVQEAPSNLSMNPPLIQSESLAIREAPDRIQVPASQPPLVIEHQTIESESADQETQEVNNDSNGNPASQHVLEPFDWLDFESRYSDAMSKANATEAELLKEFYDMVDYFGIWAVASSQYDDDRAMKRLKTREVYIQHAETSLAEKRKHYTQVVEAFKNALALLGAN